MNSQPLIILFILITISFQSCVNKKKETTKRIHAKAIGLQAEIPQSCSLKCEPFGISIYEKNQKSEFIGVTVHPYDHISQEKFINRKLYPNQTIQKIYFQTEEGIDSMLYINKSNNNTIFKAKALYENGYNDYYFYCTTYDTIIFKNFLQSIVLNTYQKELKNNQVSYFGKPSVLFDDNRTHFINNTENTFTIQFTDNNTFFLAEDWKNHLRLSAHGQVLKVIDYGLYSITPSRNVDSIQLTLFYHYPEVNRSLKLSQISTPVN